MTALFLPAGLELIPLKQGRIPSFNGSSCGPNADQTQCGRIDIGPCVCERGSCSCHQGRRAACTVCVSICVCETAEGSPWLQLNGSFSGGTLPSKLSASSPHTLQTSTQALLVLPSRDRLLFQGRAHWLFPCVPGQGKQYLDCIEGVLGLRALICVSAQIGEGVLTPSSAQWEEEDKEMTLTFVTKCANSLTHGPSYCFSFTQWSKAMWQVFSLGKSDVNMTS